MAMDTASQLSQVFASFAGGEGDEMDGRAWVKCLKDCRLLGKGVTTIDADLIFAKVKPKGGRRIDLEGFQRALALLAERKGKSEFSIVWQVAQSLGPDYSNGITVGPSTDFGPERFYYDTSTYTGTWKNGGPTTAGSHVGCGGYSHISVLVNRSVVQDDAVHRAKQERTGTPSRCSSRRSVTPTSMTSPASSRRPSISTPTTGRLSRSGSMGSIRQSPAVGTTPEKNVSRASLSSSKRASASCMPATEIIEVRREVLRRISGRPDYMTTRSCGEMTSRSEAISDCSSSQGHTAEFGGGSDGTSTSTSQKATDIHESPTSELAALCADDIPSTETRRDPKTGKVWTYSAYRSAHIAELDFQSIRTHWRNNCILVAGSEARTQEFVENWLPLPTKAKLCDDAACPGLAEDTHVVNNEPEAEAEGLQDIPQMRLIQDEILTDVPPEPAEKTSGLPVNLLNELAAIACTKKLVSQMTKKQPEKYYIGDAENDALDA